MPSKIEWVRNPDGTKGETWNPISGCTKVSPGCKNCYAERMAKRLAGRYGYPERPDHFKVTLHSDKLDLPLRWKKPRIVFVCSMSDLFHKDVPAGFIYDVFKTIGKTPQHTFQILTKRPRRMRDFIYAWSGGQIFANASFAKLHPNVWLGTSVENQGAADERIPLLLQTPAAVRFVSCEPLLEKVILQGGNVPESPDGPWPDEPLHSRAYLRGICGDERINWLICGGESGPGARPMHPDWARSLQSQCQQAGVPFFFKQHGAWLHRSQMEKLEAYTATDMYCWTSNLDASYRVGKKAAGRILDNRTWDEMPGQEPQP